jgi:hypothetical protein
VGGVNLKQLLRQIEPHARDSGKIPDNVDLGRPVGADCGRSTRRGQILRASLSLLGDNVRHTERLYRFLRITKTFKGSSCIR